MSWYCGVIVYTVGFLNRKFGCLELKSARNWSGFICLLSLHFMEFEYIAMQMLIYDINRDFAMKYCFPYNILFLRRAL